MTIPKHRRILCLSLLAVLAAVICAPTVVLAAPGAPSGGESGYAQIEPGSLAGSLMYSPDIRRKFLQTATVMAVGYFLLFAVINIINRRVRDIRDRYNFRKNVAYLINFLIFTSILLIWLQNINSLTILLGFTSAGLALALQEVILCIAGWVLIMLRRPFQAGDRIEMNGVRGDVIDTRLFQTSLLEIGNWVDADQSTGRIVHIPNSFVFKSENYNYNRGFDFIWNEIPILVTFESDWRKAHEIITSHGKRFAEGQEADVHKKIEAMKNRYMIFYGKLTPIVYVCIKDSGVLLTLRYLTEAKRRRSSQDEISRAILDDFAKHPDVNFAYPTYRIVKE